MADPTPAPEPTTSGVQYTPDGRVYVRQGDGSLVSLPAEQVESFLFEDNARRLASPADVQERQAQKEYGQGIGTEIRTGLEAAADAATLGGYSAAARALGGDEAAQGLRERRARNPLAATTGELATIGALTVATGGAGGVAGAAARATPAGLALRAGLATERAIEGAGALTRIGALTAAGTVEGALFGAGTAVRDIAQSERFTDLDAEAMLAHLGRTAGEGALYGAVGGAAVGSLFAGGSALTRRARRALEARSASKAARTADTAGEVAGDIVDDVRTPVQRLKDQASAAKRLDEQRGEFISKATNKLTEISEKVDQLAEASRGGFKRAQVEKAIEREPIANFDATAGRAQEILDGFRKQAEGWTNDPLFMAGVQGPGGGAGQIRRIMDSNDAMWGKLATSSPTDAFNQMEAYKRIVDRARKAAKGGPAKEFLEQHANEVRSFLEDAEMWGGASMLNKTHNPGWVRKLNADELDDLILSDAPYASKADPYRQGRQGDSAKVSSLFDALDRPEGATRVKNVREWLDAQADFADRAMQAYDLPKGMGKLAQDVKRLRAEIAKDLDRATVTAADKRAFAELGGAALEIPGVGASVRGAKAATSALANVADGLSVRAGRLEGMRRASGAILGGIASAARGVVTGSRKLASAGLPAAAASVGSARSRAALFERAWRAQAEFEDDPQAAVRRAWRAQGEVGRYAPMLASAQATRIAALGQLLSEKLPRHGAPSIYGEDQDKPPKITPSERDEFLRYWSAANDPMSVIEQAADGRLSREGVEVLRTGYPELYQSLRRNVVRELQEADKKPAYRQRLVIGQMLDLPTDPGLEPEMLAMLQAGALATGAGEQSAENGGILSPSRRSVPDVAGPQQTAVQRLQARTR